MVCWLICARCLVKFRKCFCQGNHSLHPRRWAGSIVTPLEEPGRATTDGRSPLDEALLERCVCLCREQALRRIARFRGRSALEKCFIQCAGAWLGADQDG